MRFRIGVHLGDVIENADGTVYGDGVNIAARLEGLAEPGGIAVSNSIRSAVKGKVSATFHDLGEQTVKNIADPVRAYAVRSAASTLAAATGIDVSAPVPGFGGRPAIAVLPFTNLSGDPEQEYFADGLAQDILTRLAMWRRVPVIARNSSFTFKGGAFDVKAVGRALGARYVLEGSVRKAGNRVRVTSQLIDTDTAHHVWAERYDRVLEDLFAIQDELTDGIVGALEAAVGRAETERARIKPPGNLDAWDTYQRGLWHLQRFTREDFAAAEALFVRAAQLDPSLAQPHTGVAMLRGKEAAFLWTAKPAESLGEAMRSAHAALAADSLDSEAHSQLGIALAFSGKHDDALAMCQNGVELNPSNAYGYHGLGLTHMLRGEPEQGIKAMESAIRISPNDVLLPLWLTTLSTVHYLARNYERSAEVARLAVQRAPNYPLGWRSLTNALGHLGKPDDARDSLSQFLTLMPSYTTESAARASVQFRDEPVFQHYLEGMRKAGWKG
jgi:TolB-like protein/Tfp pilus assembly protein PilF